MRRNRIARADLRPDGKIVAHALKLGLAPFGLTLLPEATVVAINVNLSAYGGETALAAYAVVSYTACVIQMLIQGVGDGSQPLISKHYGAGDADGVRRFRNTNYLITISLGALGLLAMYLLRNQVPLLFGSSAETAAIVAYALPIFSMAYVFYGFTHASTSYFYAVDDARASNAIVYGEAVLVVLVVFGIARVAGVDGIWFSVTIVQMVLAWGGRCCATAIGGAPRRPPPRPSRRAGAASAAPARGRPASQVGRCAGTDRPEAYERAAGPVWTGPPGRGCIVRRAVVRRCVRTRGPADALASDCATCSAALTARLLRVVPFIRRPARHRPRAGPVWRPVRAPILARAHARAPQSRLRC